MPCASAHLRTKLKKAAGIVLFVIPSQKVVDVFDMIAQRKEKYFKIMLTLD